MERRRDCGVVCYGEGLCYCYCYCYQVAFREIPMVVTACRYRVSQSVSQRIRFLVKAFSIPFSLIVLHTRVLLGISLSLTLFIYGCHGSSLLFVYALCLSR